ncbi:MAG: MBL fold metallo-hydrolase, partial [Oscillospiraceae bacterium]|nr:MBL fold metallo-hydrolase [Oscillospiraceae bacterium]
ISGFHMMKKDGGYTDDEKDVIIRTAKELSMMDTVFYTGHCTGIPAFDIMKEIMGDKLIALHCGERMI